jgi:hypothetical protein
MASGMSITCTRASPVSRLSAASVSPAPSVLARETCAPRFAVRQIPSAEVPAIGAVDLSRGNVDGLEIPPLPQHHIPLLGQFQPGDECARPSRPPAQFFSPLIFRNPGRVGQKLLERRPLGRPGKKTEDAFAGRRNGIERERHAMATSQHSAFAQQGG